MIKLPYKCYINKTDFFDYTGYNLDKDGRIRIDDTGSKESTIKSFLNEAAEMVYNYVSMQLTNKDAVELILNDDEYKDIIQLAQLLQSKYMYENGNSLAINGLNGNGTSTDLKEIRGERAYSPTMINYLNNSGLLYGGII